MNQCGSQDGRSEKEAICSYGKVQIYFQEVAAGLARHSETLVGITLRTPTNKLLCVAC